TTARVEQSAITKPPVLTAGKVSPRVLREWAQGAGGYFFHGGIIPSRQVEAVASGIRDDRLQDWYMGDKERIIALTFEQFLAEVRVKCLPEDWEYDVRSAILSSRQGASTFEDWYIKMSSENALLVGTECHIDDGILRHHLEACCHEDTAHECKEVKAYKILDFSKWINEVVRCDKKRMRVAEQHQKVVDTAVKSKTTSFIKAKPTTASITTTSFTRTNSSSAQANRVPALTSEERSLLYEFEGCLKCRRFFAGHMRAECPNDFPVASTYKTLTRADALLAKQNGSGSKQKKTVAAITVAAVGMSTGVAGNGSDSTEGDDSAYVPDTPAPHLYWDCLLDGPGAPAFLATSALIDNACTPVLIRPELATQLGLRRFRLPKPVEVGLAMGSGEVDQRFELQEWVRIQFSSPDHAWVSRSVRAIVAPGLCAPVIIGQSFLSDNSIVIDYQQRSVVDKISDYNLLKPAPISRPKPKPSPKNLPKINKVNTGTFVAAIRERIESLAFAEKLKNLDGSFKTKYADLFGALPHTDDLPTDVYHRMKLKDPLQIIACRGYASPRKYQDAW
ncbi:hypothetical protein PLICRDRAFT_73864, partial [Plicaturopsis crispa FD-325 SS-3]